MEVYLTGGVYLPGGELPVQGVFLGNKNSIFETGHCLKDHNVHFKLSLSISG